MPSLKSKLADVPEGETAQRLAVVIAHLTEEAKPAPAAKAPKAPKAPAPAKVPAK